MTPELKELWAKASPDSTSRYAGEGVPLYPALAEFAALIEEDAIRRCQDRVIYAEDVYRLRSLPRRWRSVIPSTPEKE